MATALTRDVLPHHKPEPRRRRREKPATLTPGQSVGVWRVERELGHGGMGSVYAITHKTFGKRAALKLCHRGVLGPDFTAATFLREARVINLVDHPGVPDVFGTGSYDGRPYLAMERLRGQTLGDLVRASMFSTLETLELLAELCDILAAAHAANVVHRDLKLDNVFVMDACPALGLGRRVKLLDWGIAHIVGEPDPMCGVLAGTLTSMAPEQVRGDALTPAADVYSLAVLTYQCLLRRAPFAASRDLDLIRLHLNATPPSPRCWWPAMPEVLATTLVAMLAKDPAHRPDLTDVVRALRAAHDQLQAGARPEPARRSVLALARRNLLRVTIAVAMSITGVATLLAG